MKSVRSLAIIGALWLSTVGTAGVQFNAVNPVLVSLADAVTAGDELVDWAKPVFDEKFSNFLTEQLKYDLTGQMKKTLWGSGGKASVYGSCTLVAEHGGNPGIRVTSTTGVQTDVLGLFRYGATIALGKFRSNGKYAPKIREALHRLTVVSDMNELYALIQLGQELAVDVIEDEMTHSNGPEWPRLREAYARTTITPVRRGRDVVEIKIRNAVTASGFVERTYLAVVPDQASLELTPSRAEGVLQGFASIHEGRMDRLRIDLKNVLEGLQDGSVQSKADVFRTYSRALYEFKRVIQGWL